MYTGILGNVTFDRIAQVLNKSDQELKKNKTHLGVLRPREESETEQQSKLQSQIRFLKLFTAKQEFTRRCAVAPKTSDGLPACLPACLVRCFNYLILYTLHRCHGFPLGHTAKTDRPIAQRSHSNAAAAGATSTLCFDGLETERSKDRNESYKNLPDDPERGC